MRQVLQNTTDTTDSDEELPLSIHPSTPDHPPLTAQSLSSNDHPPFICSSPELPSSLTNAVLHREERSLQADSDRILDGWAGGTRQDTVTAHSMASPMDDTPNTPIVPCRSDRLAERQATGVDNNHLLAQPSLTSEEELNGFKIACNA